MTVPALRSSVAGRVITPTDPDYDEARRLFYGGMDRRPDAIVRITDPADVIRVVTLTRDAGVPLAVRSGGHSVAGHSVTDGGVVLDLAGLRAYEIDPAAGTAWVGPGLTAGAFTVAAAEHGLALGFGDTGSVGIGGLTLGGGVGYLSRRYGLTIDDLLSADIVTADGHLVRADVDSHPDLFWAIRGGGGNFGVATRFQFRLHQLSTVVGGLLVLPATAEVIAGFIAAAAEAPEELTTIANVMPAPPMPFLPTDYHGQLVTLAMLVYAGEGADAERALAPFRALATPIADLVQPMPYPNVYPPEDESYHPVAASRNLYLDSLDAGTATMILDQLRAASASFAVAQLRVLGGAVAQVPDTATAYAHRRRRIMVNVAALCESTDDLPGLDQWVADFAAALQNGTEGAYVNFLGHDGAARIREAYPSPVWERLVDVKRRYDPDNLFRANQNITP
jgi:FAD/FMN-containing dehydrogenase